MMVTLSSGDEIEIVGPVIKQTPDGILISHRSYRAKRNGEDVTIDIGDLHDAKFPDDIVECAQKMFEETLPEVLKKWEKLLKRTNNPSTETGA